MRTRTTVHVPDAAEERRWPAYISAVATEGKGSILGIPLPQEGGATAVMNLYSPLPNGFTGGDIEILRRASNSRNVKLRDVAAAVMASITDEASVSTHFDE
jgi:GAF domain-containing protein